MMRHRMFNPRAGGERACLHQREPIGPVNAHSIAVGEEIGMIHPP